MKNSRRFYLSLSLTVIMLMVLLLINKAFAGDDTLKKIIIPTDVHLSPGQYNGMTVRGETAINDSRYRTTDDLNPQQKAALDNVMKNPVSRTIPQADRPAPQERVNVVVPNNIHLNAGQMGRVINYQSSGLIHDRRQLTPDQQKNLDYVINGKPVQNPVVNPTATVAIPVDTGGPGTPGAGKPSIVAGNTTPLGGTGTTVDTGTPGTQITATKKLATVGNSTPLNGGIGSITALAPGLPILTNTKTIDYSLFQGLPDEKKLELSQAGYQVVQAPAWKTPINPGTYNYVVTPDGIKNYVPVQTKTQSFNSLKK